MPKAPATWPIGALPARMNGECAAFFVGVSLAKFKAGVKTGKYPPSIKDGGNVLWRVRDLLAHVDGRSNPGQAKDNGYWLGLLDDADDRAARD
jgi:hypothetical protein